MKASLRQTSLQARFPRGEAVQKRQKTTIFKESARSHPLLDSTMSICDMVSSRNGEERHFLLCNGY